MSVDAILKEIEALSTVERAELKARLDVQFAGAEPAQELSPELAALLDERNAEYEANPSDVYTWDEVVAYAKSKK